MAVSGTEFPKSMVVSALAVTLGGVPTVMVVVVVSAPDPLAAINCTV